MRAYSLHDFVADTCLTGIRESLIAGLSIIFLASISRNSVEPINSNSAACLQGKLRLAARCFFGSIIHKSIIYIYNRNNRGSTIVPCRTQHTRCRRTTYL